MSDLRRRMTRIGNRFGVWLYRNLGVTGGQVLMITTPGRRTGIPRTTCVRYLDSGGGFVVWGTASGSPRDPDWFRNLRAAETADVQVGKRRLRAKPRELTGDERDVMWRDVVLAKAPEVSKFATRAGRTIPVAVLEPVDG